MSNRVTSKYFENNKNYRMYLNQVVAMGGDIITSGITDGEYEISASLGRPVNEELVRTVWGLVEYAKDPEDFSATFDKDGFDVSFTLAPHQLATVPGSVEPIVRQAVKDFLRAPAQS